MGNCCKGNFFFKLGDITTYLQIDRNYLVKCRKNDNTEEKGDN